MDKQVLLNDAQRELVSSSLHIVTRVIYSHFYMNTMCYDLKFEDLYQEGCVALCNAALHYNGSAKFTTFASIVVRNSLIDYSKKICNRRKQISFVSLDEAIPDDDGGFFSLVNKLAAPESSSPDMVIELLAAVKSGYSGITRRGIEALELKILGYTNREIAEMYSVKPNHIGAWISRASQKLRQNRRFVNSLYDLSA